MRWEMPQPCCGSWGQRLQDQHVEGALEDVCLFLDHRLHSPLDGRHDQHVVFPVECQGEHALTVPSAPVLSKNPIDAVRRADSTLDARRVATFVTAESLCSARPVCRLFPTCCSSSSWPSRAGSTSSSVTSLTLSRKRIASSESSAVLAVSGSPTPSAGAGPHRPRASGDGYAVTGTPWSRPRPSAAGIDS